MNRSLLVCVGVYLALVLRLVHSQDACERITLGDLGSLDSLSTTGILGETLATGGEASVPQVMIIDMNIVCEAQHVMRNRYRYTSVVATFNCFSTDPRVSQCADSSTVHTEQFDFGCENGEWTRAILTVSDRARTDDPIATLATQRDTGCLLCINPMHPTASASVDNVTHCQGCNNDCPTGLQRCYFDEGFTELCCNYFHNNVCVSVCPENFAPNDENECQIQCDELSTANGTFTYSNDQFIGSEATLECMDEFEEMNSPATCETPRQWSSIPICNRITCGPVSDLRNGRFGYSNEARTVGTTVIYECDLGFLLEEPEMRTCRSDRVWIPNLEPSCTSCGEKFLNCRECMYDENGEAVCTLCEDGFNLEDGECKTTSTPDPAPATNQCDPPCIIGIVLAIVAVVIIATVVVVVAFVLYKYLNDPATKLAKTDTEGLNGVARDNPLYVDPAAVTEDGLDGVPTETTPLEA